MFFCYKITNLLNGKVYIGKTNRPHERWIEHRNSNKNYPLSNAIKKYGAPNFSFEIIAISEIESAINKAESLYIEQYRSNINKKAGGTSHTKLAIKYNVSQANIGFIINNKIWRK